ncbi:fatty acid cis/trans isomerase [Motilimonas sp. E26]|uniref:fatty acid cis/trans isomerase n=1 Tax=Motilimonas sp. E26 TaxID=2865674 RepID=UPI001E3346B7|nr:fatty acid cis/trans isomerase [Motilimonas sp. E26]MCE0555540.1 fatty acid cis/trans isomerase [Motilimonas sp. E26]
MFKHMAILSLFALLTGCSSFSNTHFADLYGPALVRDRMVNQQSSDAIFYHQTVRPILDQRCVVCHGCYDAPCQLKLTSPEAIERGSSKDKVFSGTRLFAATPTRLYEDAATTEQWRKKGFSPVLNEREQTEQANVAASLIYQALLLKQKHPLVDTRAHADAFDFSLDRNQQCSTIETYQDFASNNPLAGMPYGLPAIAVDEQHQLTTWIKNGAKMAAKPPLANPILQEIDLWERWLNRPSLKSQLVARYIFEHLYLSHLYFSALANTANSPEFFTLVRSKTPPGQPIERIITLRPYDDPKVERVYYRFQRERETILAKTHMPYALNEQRMDQLNQLFYRVDYQVTALPSYEPSVAANPFIAFEALPVAARYRFMLLEAQNTIMAFIKGPVCRGQMALNVINDHFWVFFSEGSWENSEGLAQFLAQQKDHLRIPAESASNSTVLSSWFTYSKAQKRYLKAKQGALAQAFENGEKLDLDLVWDGEETNTNAALTVFRHFDNASVVKGLVGQAPKTAWLIDYPILERIHYLLVAGFDVYGNVGHQLNTRLYMDFLRMESEFNFLALLPPDSRISERDHWYRNTSDNIQKYLKAEQSQFHYPSDVTYQTNQHKLELFSMLKAKLGPVLKNNYDLQQVDVSASEWANLATLFELPSTAVNQLAEVSVLLVQDGKQQRLYTLIKNAAYSNMSSLLRDSNNRLPGEDNLTVVRGLIGDYPNVFLHIQASQIPQFVRTLQEIKSDQDYSQLLDQYGVRRSSPVFWAISDRVLNQVMKEQPISGGLLDYNRLENR